MEVTPGIIFIFFSEDSPGRFFAVTEMKLILAFVLLKYDIKTLDGKRPEDVKFYWVIMPDLKAKILFRRRQC